MGVGRIIRNPITADQKAIANGVATLDGSAKVPKNQISLTAGDVGAQPTGNELTALQELADSPGFLKKIGDGVYSIDSSSFLSVVGGVATISSAQQFTGFVLSNGSATVAQLIGTGATNDIGAIVLRSAETANILLTASGNSYINGGNLGIGTPSPSSPLDVNGLAKISTLNITATTPSTSPTSGASVIAGGQGISGDLHIGGFTSFGGTAGGHPAIRIKKISGTTGATQGSQTIVAHEVTQSKILSVITSVSWSGLIGDWVGAGYVHTAGYQYDWSLGGGAVSIFLHATNSGNILNKPLQILIIYIS